MAQKTLPLLHKAITSLTWTSIIYDKNYKWLSYNLWFAYIQFYKINFFFYFRVKKKNYYFFNYNNKFLKNKKFKYFHIETLKLRFSYHLDLYCIEFFNNLILLNIYFYNNLHSLKKNRLSSFQKLPKTSELFLF